MKRNELTFQNHIIKSYERAGGHAKKWASEWQAHQPDLICSLPGIGLHLLEVKHCPTLGSRTNFVKNALTKGQQYECYEYLKAGAKVYAAVVGFSSEARGSKLALFYPILEQWHVTYPDKWAPYELGKGFDVSALFNSN